MLSSDTGTERDCHAVTLRIDIFCYVILGKLWSTCRVGNAPLGVFLMLSTLASRRAGAGVDRRVILETEKAEIQGKASDRSDLI